MKKTIYIFVFVIAGILFQFLIHAVVEICYINLLVKDFSKYGFGLSWQQWYMIHHVASFVLLIIGIVIGLWQGKFWWQRSYKRLK